MQKPSAYSFVTQTQSGPVELKIDSALKGQVDGTTLHVLAQGADSRGFTITTPARAGSFHGAVGSVGVSAEDFGGLLGAISGRNLIVICVF